ncbi:uncharacterized protein LOC134277745 [Saccostrea cucullata]|uniref:uncharacterized protein LOC134277745 n=1 Tax=Saccostrea cuccullata TaxID=36930 RepID=UPI002ED6B4EC
MGLLNMDIFLIVLLTFAFLLESVNGHGRLLDPPSRSSMWRFGLSPIKNYNDNQLSCGGFANQYLYQHGKCGVCGDPYQGPRENEAGGKYARGFLSRRYVEGQMIDIVVEVTALHYGWFEFRICPNNDINRAVTQECLDKHLLVLSTGATRFTEVTSTGKYLLHAQLPAGLTCSQCVVQWKWHTGNNFGLAPDGHRCMGCGPQEEFYGCSDVTITPKTTPMYYPNSTPHPDTPSPVYVTQTTEIITQPPPQTSTPPKNSGGFPINIFPGVPLVNPTTTEAPLQPGTRCYAINLWAGDPVLNEWCATNCANGNCPASACACA